MTLGEFLLDAAGHGQGNCSTLPGDWCVARGNPDFFAPWRGVVSEVDIAAATVDGLLPLWEGAIGDGLPPAAAPFLAGDIAVLRVRGIEVGAVYAGSSWAVRKSKGLSFVSLSDHHAVKAWRP